MTWFTYEIPPIDNHWELLRTVAEVAQQLAVREAEFIVKEGRDSAVALPITLEEFSKRWETAKDAAFAAGWEGGFREEPRVVLVPDECDFLIGFVIKQDNNGTTYVMSPVEMPHLKEYV